MNEVIPDVEKIFASETLVYTGETAKIEDYIQLGIPGENKNRLFGGRSRGEVRLGLLGNRSSLEERLLHSSCLVPKFKGRENCFVGIALNTSEMLSAYGEQIRAVGLGFKEDCYKDIYPTKRGRVGGILVSHGEDDGFLDEIRVSLERQKVLFTPLFIEGVLINELDEFMVDLVTTYSEIPFFLKSGEYIKPD